jgi:hypothetical protein
MNFLQTLTFLVFLQEFLRGKILHLGTNVKKMEKTEVFFCIIRPKMVGKSSNVKFFEKWTN